MEEILLIFFRRLLDDYIVTNTGKFNSQFSGTPSAKYLQYVDGVLVLDCLIDSPMPLVTDTVMNKDLEHMRNMLNARVVPVMRIFENMLYRKKSEYISICKRIKELVYRCNTRGQDYVDAIELEHLQRLANTCELDMQCLQDLLCSRPYITAIYKSCSDGRYLVFEFSY